MNLPDYFLADLPPEAVLSAPMIADACQALMRNREQYLFNRSTNSLIGVLSALAECWLDADYPFRQLALKLGPAATGFSAATLGGGLDAFFSQLTADNLRVLLQQELGHAERLDRFVSTVSEHKAQRTALATGPGLLVHFAAGNLPSPILMSLVLGLLVRSSQF